MTQDTSFAAELKKLIDPDGDYEDEDCKDIISYIGSAAYIMNGDYKIRVRFIEGHLSNTYDHIELHAINQTTGCIADKLILNMTRLIGRIPTQNINYSAKGVCPHLEACDGSRGEEPTVRWSIEEPLADQWRTLRIAVWNYVRVWD